MSLEVKFLIYLVCSNSISGILFKYDKIAAIKNKKRIAEITLHIVELIGGVFINVLLIYALRHKNRKFKYYSITWLIFICWVFGLIFINKYI